MRTGLFYAACITAAIALSFCRAAAIAQPSSPVITPLPAGAVTLESCNWNAKSTAFDADIRLKDHTNLPIEKARLLLTFVNTQGETVKAYADMAGSAVTLAKGVPMTGRWSHGTFPLSMKTMQCALIGVKFRGYPNVIFSAVQ